MSSILQAFAKGLGLLNGNHGFMEDGILFGFSVVLFVKSGGGATLIESKVVGSVMSEEFSGVGCGGGWEVFTNVEWELLYGTVLLFLRSSAARLLRSSRAWSLNPSNVSWEDTGCCSLGTGHEVLTCFSDSSCGFDSAEGLTVSTATKG